MTWCLEQLGKFTSKSHYKFMTLVVSGTKIWWQSRNAEYPSKCKSFFGWLFTTESNAGFNWKKGNGLVQFSARFVVRCKQLTIFSFNAQLPLIFGLSFELCCAGLVPQLVSRGCLPVGDHCRGSKSVSFFFFVQELFGHCGRQGSMQFLTTRCQDPEVSNGDPQDHMLLKTCRPSLKPRT